MAENVLSEEPVTTDGNGNPILGYRLKRDMLQAFVKQVRALTNNQCLFATKEEGDVINVVVIPYGDKPSQDFLDGMARLQSDVSIKTMLASDMEATSVSFDAPPNRTPGR